MMIDKENVFFWKKAITANTNSEVVMNGEGGDAVVAPWLVIRIDADVTGTGLFNVYTSKKGIVKQTITDTGAEETQIITWTLKNNEAYQLFRLYQQGHALLDTFFV